MMGIYIVTCLETDHQYVGQAVDIAQRWREHRQKLARGAHPRWRWQDDWDTHGPDAFTWEVLEEVADSAALSSRETYYIRALRPQYNGGVARREPSPKPTAATSPPPMPLEFVVQGGFATRLIARDAAGDERLLCAADANRLWRATQEMIGEVSRRGGMQAPGVREWVDKQTADLVAQAFACPRALTRTPEQPTEPAAKPQE